MKEKPSIQSLGGTARARKLSQKEKVEIARKAGIASGKARKAKATRKGGLIT